MPHNMIALVFRVEYTAMLPIKPHARSISYTIGWDIMLPTLNSEMQIHDQKIDFFCKMGPGNTLSREILWS